MDGLDNLMSVGDELDEDEGSVDDEDTGDK